MSTKIKKATVEDLYKLGKEYNAELVDDELVIMEPTGGYPTFASTRIVVSLAEYERQHKNGHALSDGVAYLVDLPRRKSFSPDASYYLGKLSMKFLDGAPVFAAEVRSEHDYGPAAEKRMARKRADYFAAGTLTVWDVDLLSDGVIRSYRKESPENPVVYRKGETAHALPALPGWSMPVDELFPKEQ